MDRREARRAYKETPRPAGVYAVRNTVDGRWLVGSSLNLPGMLNRHRFDLENHAHRVRELQADWDRLGEEAFAFEVLDTIERPDDPDADLSEDLATLVAMWIEMLALPDSALYPTR